MVQLELDLKLLLANRRRV